jgi:MoxR-like ATPase
VKESTQVFETQSIQVSTAFNMPTIAPQVKLPGFKPGLPGVPKIDPGYVFDMERLRDLTMFWVGGFKALLVEGDPAAGKTSLVSQWHARLNVPLDSVACGRGTMQHHLFGQLLPTESGSLKWHDGPVTRACRNGTSVLLDEYNNMDPSEQTALNMVLEGNAFTIPETGEVITPAPTTRFFATQNPEDSEAAVAGRNALDVANEDRFIVMAVDYIKEDQERAVVENSLRGVAQEDFARLIAEVTVKVANEVRTAFRAKVDGIEKPMSTRKVIQWARLIAMYHPVLTKATPKRSGFHHTAPRALKMPVTMAQAVNEIITKVTGFDENMGQ